MNQRADRLARYRAARQRVAPRSSMTAFEALVAEALDDLPPYIQERLENVAVVVEERRARRWAPGYDPNGPARAVRGYQPPAIAPAATTWPRRIGSRCSGAQSSTKSARAIRDALRREVRKTIIHEVAHHFGIGDAELERLGG